MRFLVRVPTGDSMSLDVPDSVTEWLVAEARSPVLSRLDAYRDSAFSGADLRDFADAVGAALREKADAARERVSATTRLPKDAAVRDTILDGLVDRALAQDPVASGLRELHSLLELARDGSAIVHVDSD